MKNKNLIELNNTELILNDDENGNQNIFEHIEITRENTAELQRDFQKANNQQISSQEKNKIKIEEIEDL